MQSCPDTITATCYSRTGRFNYIFRIFSSNLPHRSERLKKPKQVSRKLSSLYGKLIYLSQICCKGGRSKSIIVNTTMTQGKYCITKNNLHFPPRQNDNKKSWLYNVLSTYYIMNITDRCKDFGFFSTAFVGTLVIPLSYLIYSCSSLRLRNYWISHLWKAPRRRHFKRNCGMYNRLKSFEIVSVTSDRVPAMAVKVQLHCIKSM